jgi:hypothetical protein
LRQLFIGFLGWPQKPFYIDFDGERHYFHTTRNVDWLTALSSATGLTPRRRRA